VYSSRAKKKARKLYADNARMPTMTLEYFSGDYMRCGTGIEALSSGAEYFDGNIVRSFKSSEGRLKSKHE
jgi:hypothetical protein